MLNCYIIDITYYKLHDYNILKRNIWLNKIFAEFQINIIQKIIDMYLYASISIINNQYWEINH